MVRNVRGKGLFGAYDIVSPELRDKFIKTCWSEKMLILPCGDNSVRFRPALNVPLEDIDKGLERPMRVPRRSSGERIAESWRTTNTGCSSAL